MRMVNRGLVTVLFLFIYCFSFGQFQESEHEIFILKRHQKDKILLRWAPSSIEAWEQGNIYGYYLERYTVFRDGKLLDKPEKKVLTTKPIKPDAMPLWESIIDTNDYAAILAQSLYGDGFQVTNPQEDNFLLQIVNQSKEREQRYSFGLFAADMSFTAAKKAGLGYVDNNIKPNEDYFYKIISAIPQNILVAKSIGVLVKKAERIKLPKPIELFSVAKEEGVLLTWDYDLLKTIYVAYHIERSVDGVNYEKINKQPIVNINKDKQGTFPRMIYMDTGDYEVKYYYRVKGITSFGEEGPVSEVVNSTLYKKLKQVPEIKDYRLLSNNTARLQWIFETEKGIKLERFELLRGITDQGPFKKIKDIDKNKREVEILSLLPSNYLKIRAVTSKREQTNSQVVFIQTIDETPPAIPSGLSGKIDSLGVVNVKWTANQEQDLLGYRVFRANTEKEEYIQLTVSPIKTNVFIDSVKVRSLNDKVYYKIVSVDQRFNMSDYSKSLVLKKPDVVPPISPVLATYTVLADKVELTWHSSESKDVRYHKLYRKRIAAEKTSWQLLHTNIDVTKKAYTDNTVKEQEKYRYAIFAEDFSGLISKPSPPITITTKLSRKKAKLIDKFNANVDRKKAQVVLYWKLQITEGDITLFRSKNNEKPRLLKQYAKLVDKLTDEELNPGNQYRYILKVKDIKGHTDIKKIRVSY